MSNDAPISDYDYGRSDLGDGEIAPYDYGVGHNNPPEQLDAQFADCFLELFEAARYKVYYGGRGSGKSWAFARALIMLAATRCLRILCCREFQSSINESVHYILVDQMDKLGLTPWFEVTDKSITCPATGSEFIFKGLRLHINEIKSTEGVDICWIEEGQALSRQSLNTLDPTIRKLGSEIWISYNPLNDSDPVHERFALQGMPEYDSAGNRYAIIRNVNFADNPWFPPELEKMRARMLNEDQDIYAHVWGGQTLQVSDAMIFRGKWSVREFSAPEGVIFRYGADWGFSQDPTVLIRCYEHEESLWIDYEVFGDRVDMDYIPALFAGNDVWVAPPRWDNDRGYAGVPGAANWPIKGDGAQPQVISYLARRGLNITAAEKWPGSVEDGIIHLRAFKHIYIHPRCPRMQEEALMYRFKVERQTGLVLPLIVDAYNHGWDAIRYSLDGFIQQRGEMGMWRRLGQED